MTAPDCIDPQRFGAAVDAMAGAYAGLTPSAFAAHPSREALGTLLRAALAELGTCGATTSAEVLVGGEPAVYVCDQLPGHGGHWNDGATSNPDHGRCRWPAGQELEQLAAEQGVTPFNPDTFAFDPPLTDQERNDLLDVHRADNQALTGALTDLVAKATPFGTQDGDFIAHYILPTGPIHRAIPLLDAHGIHARPGYDPRTDNEGDDTDG